MKAGKTAVLFTVLMLAAVAAGSIFAQEGRGTGRVRGSAKDTEGKSLVGVEITALNVRYNITFKSKSDKKGIWSVGGLGTGTYRFTATLEGYEPAFRDTKVTQTFMNNDILDFVLKKVETIEVLSGMENDENRALFKNGLRLFEEENFAEALMAFQDFLEKTPELYQVNINIGNCYKEMRDFDKAIGSFQLVLDKVLEEKGVLDGSETAALALASIGETHMDREDLDTARDYLQQALAVFPQDPTMAYKVGEIYFKRGDTDNGIIYYEKAIQIKPDWGPPYRQLGYAYLNKADYQKAVDSFKKYLEIDPTGSQAATVKALIPQLEGMIKK